MPEGEWNLRQRIQEQTVRSTQDFYDDSLGRLEGILRGDRAQLEDVAERLPEGGASPVGGPRHTLCQRTRPATQTGPRSFLQGGRLAPLSDRPSKSTGQGSQRIGRISARPSELIILIPLTSFAIVTKTLHCRRTPRSTVRSMRRSM